MENWDDQAYVYSKKSYIDGKFGFGFRLCIISRITS